MPNDPSLAHSRRGGASAQEYVQHVTNVRREARKNARRAGVFYKGDVDSFVNWVDAAAIYHDLGKLDEANQAVLRAGSRTPLPIAHEDAGVAELDRQQRRESVALVAAHHAGLFSFREDVLAQQGRPFRQLKRTTPAGIPVADHTDAKGRLDSYCGHHHSAGCPELSRIDGEALQRCGFTRRLALSCLVDADHGDTARHYGGEIVTPGIETRWKERAEALGRYVGSLPDGKTERVRRRNELRRRVFEACRTAPVCPPIQTCAAPVGSGKTTAVMAHLLNVACEKDLRHIFVVLPYTNIITQSVEVYRKALVLEGEHPEDVVAEHHHRADFQVVELRQLATLWKAPIIVTTAVQFFETLGSNRPAQLRKLHELPGSAVVVDEMHAAMPSYLWPQMWRWLEAWTTDWGGHLVMASGSLPRFWELHEYSRLIRGESPRAMPDVPDLLSDSRLRNEGRELEASRIRLKRRPEKAEALECDGLIQFVLDKPGPRLLIVNTVHTAAAIARAMRAQHRDVLHLSTALAPAHREGIVARIKARLRDELEDWTLVATSCVEAGMDFSFRTGFRESASTASLIQTGGRVSRGAEHGDAEVWDLLLRDDSFRQNPTLKISRQTLDRFTEAELNCRERAELATRAMQNEWTYGAEEVARKLVCAEDEMEYPAVREFCRLIDADTRIVIIDPGVADAIREHRRVSSTELLCYSVQIWATKIDKLGLEQLPGNNGLYVWAGGYDADFLGYMDGVFRTEEFLAAGGAVI